MRWYYCQDMPLLSRVVLYLGAIFFGAFGVWLLIDPSGLAATGLPVDPRSLWRVEIRSFFGGLEIGLAVLFFLCARRPTWAPAGLAATALILGGMGLGRAVGLLLEHRTDTQMLINMVSELGGAALAAAAFRAHERKAQTPAAG